MAAATESVTRNYELGEHNDLPVKASTIIYKGSMVGDNGGYARGLVTSKNASNFFGFCNHKADNSGGANGDVMVNILTQGRVVIDLTGLKDTDLGKAVHAIDDATFTLDADDGASSNKVLYPRVGKIIRFVESGVGILAFNAEA